MNAITITACNRPHYLEQVVESILQNDTTGFNRVFCAIEPEQRDNNLRALDKLKHKFERIDYIFNKVQLGVRQNPFNVLKFVFNEYTGFDFCFYLEDDQLLSPDAFDFMRYYIENFRDERNLLCANLYNYNSNPHADAIVYKEDQFCAIGVGMFDWQWNKYFKPHWFDEDIRVKHHIDLGGKGGWDWSVRAAMKEYKLQTLVPALSRSLHIGVNGVHCDQLCYDKMFKNHPYNTKKVESFSYVDFDCASL